MNDAGVIVPIRAFVDGKSRLAPYLDADDRARLLEAMAERVIAAAAPNHAVVVSSAPEVVAWAGRLGLDTIDDPGSLDGAAAAGLEYWRTGRVERAVVAHADLPLVDSLDALTRPGAAPVAVVVPCHRDDGTPLLSLPVTLPDGASFSFSYGPGSFARHVAEARRVGLEVVELRDDPRLRQDVDGVEDLEALTELGP